jgi:hypothetical protein
MRRLTFERPWIVRKIVGLANDCTGGGGRKRLEVEDRISIGEGYGWEVDESENPKKMECLSGCALCHASDAN